MNTYRWASHMQYILVWRIYFILGWFLRLEMHRTCAMKIWFEIFIDCVLRMNGTKIGVQKFLFRIVHRETMIRDKWHAIKQMDVGM